MLLKDALRTQGNWLFRWRGYLPFALLPVAVLAVRESAYFLDWFGATGEEAWEVFCLLVSLCGLLVRALTVGYAPRGTSGRNTRTQRAETLNTTGLYSVVRNPLYVGNFLVLLGFVLAIKVWWFCLLAGVGFALYYERIILAEEAFLERRFGQAYAAWAASTPALLPNLRRWRRPALAFSMRTVLRREYNGFFLICAFFTANEIAYDILVEGETWAQWLEEEPAWLLLFAIGAVTFLALRTLKRHTRLLQVAGR